MNTADIMRGAEEVPNYRLGQVVRAMSENGRIYDYEVKCITPSGLDHSGREYMQVALLNTTHHNIEQWCDFAIAIMEEEARKAIQSGQKPEGEPQPFRTVIAYNLDGLTGTITSDQRPSIDAIARIHSQHYMTQTLNGLIEDGAQVEFFSYWIPGAAESERQILLMRARIIDTLQANERDNCPGLICDTCGHYDSDGAMTDRGSAITFYNRGWRVDAEMWATCPKCSTKPTA